MTGRKGRIICVPQHATAGIEKARGLTEDTDHSDAVAVAAVVAEVRSVRVRWRGAAVIEVWGGVAGKLYAFGTIQVVRRHMGGDILQFFMAIVESYCGLEDQQCDQQIAGSKNIHCRGIALGDMPQTLAKRLPALNFGQGIRSPGHSALRLPWPTWLPIFIWTSFRSASAKYCR